MTTCTGGIYTSGLLALSILDNQCEPSPPVMLLFSRPFFFLSGKQVVLFFLQFQQQESQAIQKWANSLGVSSP